MLDDTALCLRCADDEPCVYVTAPRPNAPYDPYAIPTVTREDRQAIQDMSRPAKANVPTGKLDRAAKEEIVRAGKEISVAQLARKFGVSKTMIFKVRSEYRQRIRPVEQQIGGETVLIAPNAMFGAEMLKARQDEPKKNI